jgi:hypothetical protein
MMKPAITGREAAEDEDLLVHDWPVSLPTAGSRQAAASSSEMVTNMGTS